jgi:hypothetical protein
VAFGAQPSRRRGQGAEIAGSRPYVPGDRLAAIDWPASARLSRVSDADTFIVREYYDEVTPRVIIVVDRRPSMALYPADLPWLSKPAVLREATNTIIAAAHARRAYVGYLDFYTRPNAESAPYWLAPNRRISGRVVERLEHDFRARRDSFALALEYLLTRGRDAPAGTFVFLLSDFIDPPASVIWSKARARGWDMIPVVVQDPVWEQSFPPIGGLLIPVHDPQTDKTTSVRLTAAEAGERADAHATRLRELLHGFRRQSIEPVLLSSSDPPRIDKAFFGWATKRRLARGGKQ